MRSCVFYYRVRSLMAACCSVLLTRPRVDLSTMINKQIVVVAAAAVVVDDDDNNNDSDDGV